MNTEQKEEKEPCEEQTITKTPPPQRVKNPKRVPQGKRLAEISKFAKQAKRKQREQCEENERKNRETNKVDKVDKVDNENSTTSLISSTGTILGTCCTLLLTYIAYTKWSENYGTPKTVPGPKRSTVVYNDLSKYDI